MVEKDMTPEHHSLQMPAWIWQEIERLRVGREAYDRNMTRNGFIRLAVEKLVEHYSQLLEEA